MLRKSDAPDGVKFFKEVWQVEIPLEVLEDIIGRDHTFAYSYDGQYQLAKEYGFKYAKERTK